MRAVQVVIHAAVAGGGATVVFNIDVASTAVVGSACAAILSPSIGIAVVIVRIIVGRRPARAVITAAANDTIPRLMMCHAVAYVWIRLPTRLSAMIVRRPWHVDVGIVRVGVPVDSVVFGPRILLRVPVHCQCSVHASLRRW